MLRLLVNFLALAVTFAGANPLYSEDLLPLSKGKEAVILLPLFPWIIEAPRPLCAKPSHL